MIIKVKKYGQVTRVTLDDLKLYDTAVNPKFAKQHIQALLTALNIQDVRVEIDE